MDILVKNQWVHGDQGKTYAITSQGLCRLRSSVREAKEKHLNVAAYGTVSKSALLAMFSSLSIS
jgi:hypothetical protein